MTDAPNVLVLADLHLDEWLDKGRDPLASLDPVILASLDALIVAGDLSSKPKVRWPRMLAHLGRYVPMARIHVLPGNHDYYDHVLGGDARLARICDEAGAHFAQKRVIIIGAARYLCCTLWTDFALQELAQTGMYNAGQIMNDYRYIRMESERYRRIAPIDTARIHAEHRAWLEAQLADARFTPDQNTSAATKNTTDFLPIEIEGTAWSSEMPDTPISPRLPETGAVISAQRVDITLSGGRRILVEGSTALSAVVGLVQGLMT